eukprot:5069143-Prymnesium_polylepis.1
MAPYAVTSARAFVSRSHGHAARDPSNHARRPAVLYTLAFECSTNSTTPHGNVAVALSSGRATGVTLRR